MLIELVCLSNFRAYSFFEMSIFGTMKSYRLDRTAFSAQTMEEASNKYGYWKQQSYAERLRASFYLNSVAFNFDINNPPRLDRTVF